MLGPHNDDTPSFSQAVAFDVFEILQEYEPKTPEHLELLAAVTERSQRRYVGGAALALAVAGELRRLAQAMRDAG